MNLITQNRITRKLDNASIVLKSSNKRITDLCEVISTKNEQLNTKNEEVEKLNKIIIDQQKHLKFFIDELRKHQ